MQSVGFLGVVCGAVGSPARCPACAGALSELHLVGKAGCRAGSGRGGAGGAAKCGGRVRLSLTARRRPAVVNKSSELGRSCCPTPGKGSGVGGERDARSPVLAVLPGEVR